MFAGLSLVSPSTLYDRKSSRIHSAKDMNSRGFLSILDNIEITVLRNKIKLAKILEVKFMKGKKKAPAIIELDFYARAFIF